jgi:3-methyladenine DNA glycosylase AlkD
VLSPRIHARRAAGVEEVAREELLGELGDDRRDLRDADRSARPHDRGLVPAIGSWSSHRNLWVRRASVVALIPSVRRGAALAEGYATARRLQRDREDLVQKAVGWMLREAGKVDAARLERYLRREGPRTPRTTLRYAIERFPIAKRRGLLATTRA